MVVGTDLLSVETLSVSFPLINGSVEAVRSLSMRVAPGRVTALVGESGSGKSALGRAIMGIESDYARISGKAVFNDPQGDGPVDLISLPRDGRRIRQIRGDRIGMIFQEPMTALNPVHSIGRQVAEPLRLHRGVSAAEARKQAIALLDRVGIPDAARRIDAYPHQFSGGQRQRITIAMALACGPDLLIADEPTTALDVTIQQQILDLISELVAERGMALMLISHDLGVIAQNVDRMLVMYGGSVVESGPTDTVFANKLHPYSRGLFGARPSLGSARGQRLVTIAGTVPELVDLPVGCPFAGRCRYTVAECHTTPPPAIDVGDDHQVRCIRLDAVAAELQAEALT